MSSEMDMVIRVENVGKKYRLRHQGAMPYRALRDVWAEAVRGWGGRLSGHGQRGGVCKENFWALQDVSFAVQRGERLGIIGRNGAGKSTLLKLLSRISAPSKGRILIKGLVGSLLEVGTGFHPELTGRENIFLNGAILGMKRVEIHRQFDEIVAFAEVEKFLDTPVKRYSSGMYVRLAFAVAAHLDTDILLVDEVLAVGDAQFQKKCLGKMEDITRLGRTILFVSHNMGAIKRLCGRTLVIDRGRIIIDDKSDKAIDTYLSKFSLTDSDSSFKPRKHDEVKNGFMDIFFMNEIGRTEIIPSGSPMSIHLKYKVEEGNRNFDWGISIYDDNDIALLHFGSLYSLKEKTTLPKYGSIICSIPKLPLPEGKYRCNFSMHQDGKYIEHLIGAAFLYVSKGDFFETGSIPLSSTAKVLVDHSWVIKEDTNGTP